MEYNGTNALGAALAGMASPNQDAYYEGAKRAATLEDAIADAKMARQKAQLMADMPAAVRKYFEADPRQADLASVVIPGGAGADLSSTVQAFGRQADNQRREDIFTYGTSGLATPDNVNLFNAAAGKGMLTANNVGINDRASALTDAVIAQAEQRRAAAGASGASAGASNARAGLYGAQTAEVAPNAASSRSVNDARIEKLGRVTEDLDEAVSGVAPDAPKPPPAALKQIMALKPGEVAQFPNGQTWKLVNGKPKRIK